MKKCPCVDYEVVIEILSENIRLKEENNKLRSQIEERDKIIIELKEEVRLLQNKIENLKESLLYAYQYGIKRKPIVEQKTTEKTYPKKRGAPLGHKGKSRNRPKQIDERFEYLLKKCPKCGSEKIKMCGRVDSRIVEDIVIKKKTIEVLHYHYYCYNCKKTSSTHHLDKFSRKRIGPEARRLASYLHNYRKVSYGDIKGIFKDLFDLELSTSTLCEFDNEICRKGESFYNDLERLIRLSYVAYGDETGWLVGDKQEWLWVFVGKIRNDRKAVLHKIKGTRSGKVAEKILGKEYGGILGSDRYPGYNRIKAKAKQKSIPHILKEIKETIRLWNPDKESKTFLESVKNLLQDAIKIKKAWKSGETSTEEVTIKRREFQNELERLTQKELLCKKAEKIRKSLVRYKDEIFTFLQYFDVEPDTNIVERAIRLCVILRKITYGNNSPKGARNREVIMSLIQTAKINGHQPFILLGKLLEGDEDGVRELLYGNVNFDERNDLSYGTVELQTTDMELLYQASNVGFL